MQKLLESFKNPKFKNTSGKFKNPSNKLMNKKRKVFIKTKYQKRFKLFSDFRYVTSSFKFSKIKFYKKKIQVLKKYYSIYTGIKTKVFHKLITDSGRKNDFLIERRLDIFICRYFGGSLSQRGRELSRGKILVNGNVKSGNYLLQSNDFIYWITGEKFKVKRVQRLFASSRKRTSSMMFLKKICGVFYPQTFDWGRTVRCVIWKPVIRTRNKWQLKIGKDLIKKFWNKKSMKVFLYKKKI